MPSPASWLTLRSCLFAPLPSTWIDDAVHTAGFEVVGFDVKSPEYSEALLEENPTEVTGQLARISQLRRTRAVLEDALGSSWYERWLAWSHWQTYLFLGKLETAAWMLRKPRSRTP